MSQIETKSLDMILCDLPYGETGYDWDIKEIQGFVKRYDISEFRRK